MNTGNQAWTLVCHQLAGQPRQRPQAFRAPSAHLQSQGPSDQRFPRRLAPALAGTTLPVWSERYRRSTCAA